MKISLLVAALAMAVVASQAFAAVTFDKVTGEGFSGKGDVQSAFGWNNQRLQRNANDVSFKYSVVDEWTARCEWRTGRNTNFRDHVITRERTTRVRGNVDADPRTSPNQFTGFILHGWDGNVIESGGTAPVEGEPCPGKRMDDGTWVSVVHNITGGLYATHDGVSKLIADANTL